MGIYQKDKVHQNIQSETVRSYKVNTASKCEPSVQIKVGKGETHVDVATERDEGVYNEYLTSTKGPKQGVNYSNVNSDLPDDPYTELDNPEAQTEDSQLAQALKQIQDLEN